MKTMPNIIEADIQVIKKFIWPQAVKINIESKHYNFFYQS